MSYSLESDEALVRVPWFLFERFSLYPFRLKDPSQNQDPEV